MRIPSISGYRYFAVFVCAWSGAKHCEFLARENHFIDAYRRILATTGIKPQYIRTLRTNQGGKFINHSMQALLTEHLTNHVVCAKDKHYSVGAAETAVNNLRHSARAMMLHGNVPKRFWHFAVAHAAYIHNVTSPSRVDKAKTIFELLFSKRADLTQVPPYGCSPQYTKNRRTLQDQSLDPFIRSRCIYRHSKTQRRNRILCERRISNHRHTPESGIRSTPLSISPETTLRSSLANIS